MQQTDIIIGKEGERGQIPCFETIDIKQLATKSKEVWSVGKYLFIVDMTSQKLAATFFKYRTEWTLFDFHCLVRKALI